MNSMNTRVAMHIERRLKSRLSCLLLFISVFSVSFPANAALLVTPSRVVFEDRNRSEQVTVTNKGDELTTYRISFVRKKMTEDGKFVPVGKDEEGMFSDEMVRYSPRQINLAPGQSQVVRLLLRKPRGLADGEYRSHLLMQALPKVTESDISKAVEKGADAISVEITTVIGISIPVIVRHGKLDNEVSLSNAKYVQSSDAKKKSFVSLDMNRTGKRSTYGDFRVSYINEAGDSAVIAIVKGIAVYADNPVRNI